ncbi:2-amino-4-hydroxy-6-hydroxymethyldihydropteridine diphosphokinase [Devosia riboflavina]
MAKAWLSLGANIGNPPAQLVEAVRLLDAHPHIKVTKQSSVIATKPWGKTDQPDFANMAAEVETDLRADRPAACSARYRARNGARAARGLGTAADRCRYHRL